MHAYRLAKAQYAALDGEGARLYGGRWNSRGVAMVYLASSASLALVELLVHLNPGVIPPEMVLLTIEIPDDIASETLHPLPGDWNLDPPPLACQMAGDRWARSARSAIMRVPSVIVPMESNLLLNPLHPESRRINTIKTESFPFDSRFFHTRGR